MAFMASMVASKLSTRLIVNRQGLRKSIEICPPTPNSGGARDQIPPELGDLGGECVSPTRVFLDFIFDEFDIYWEKLSNDDIKW